MSICVKSFICSENSLDGHRATNLDVDNREKKKNTTQRAIVSESLFS